MADIGRLCAAMRTMVHAELRSGYGFAAGAIDEFANESLFPSETSAVKGVGSRRLRTFRAGRACAHAAMLQLGLEPQPIEAGDSGAPIWPTGLLGSISHTDEVAAAVVVHAGAVSGVGFDLEGDEPLDNEEMMRIVCRPEELMEGFDASDPVNLRRGKRLFVIKEAVYKLLSPRYHAFFDFQELRVLLDEDRNTFAARLIASKPAQQWYGKSSMGSFGQAEGFFFAIASRISIS